MIEQTEQDVSNRLTVKLSRCGVPHNPGVLLKARLQPVPVLALFSDLLVTIDDFVHFGSLITSKGGIEQKDTSAIGKIRINSAELRHLFHCRDARLFLN